MAIYNIEDIECEAKARYYKKLKDVDWIAAHIKFLLTLEGTTQQTGKTYKFQIY